MTEVRVLKMFVNGEFEEHYNHEYLKVLYTYFYKKI